MQLFLDIFLGYCQIQPGEKVADLVVYEEIGTLMTGGFEKRPPILRPPCFLASEIFEDSDESTEVMAMIPRPKIGWPNRKVTFGKLYLATLVHLHSPISRTSSIEIIFHSFTSESMSISGLENAPKNINLAL